jgi:1-acyl-sn-glycerol-3-phosphate acyltransferase
VGETFHKVIVFTFRFPFWVSSRPVHLHVDRVPRDGAFILASSHLSPFDVPALMRSSPRRLDFVSTTEIFQNKFIAWFYGNMGTFPIDRSRSDPKTVRVIIDRLARGGVVAIFPEGRIRKESDSVVSGGRMRPTIARLAKLANVPIVPAVVWGSNAYMRPTSWLPLRRVRYGVNYGEPFVVEDEAEGERQLAGQFQRLYAELREAMGVAAPAPAPPSQNPQPAAGESPAVR